MSRRRLLQSGLVAGGTLALGGSALRHVRADERAAPKAGGSLAVGLTVYHAPEDFDPIALQPNAVSPFLHGLDYDRLLRLAADGRTVEAGLAESWQVSSDGLVYTFRLRAARFHDGSAVTAGDVVWSFQRMREHPAVAGQTPVYAAEAPDERTVVLRLDRSHTPLPATLALTFASVLPRAQVEAQ